jgi:hypothetical protein
MSGGFAVGIAFISCIYSCEHAMAYPLRNERTDINTQPTVQQMKDIMPSTPSQCVHTSLNEIRSAVLGHTTRFGFIPVHPELGPLINRESTDDPDQKITSSKPVDPSPYARLKAPYTCPSIKGQCKVFEIWNLLHPTPSSFLDVVASSTVIGDTMPEVKKATGFRR